MGRATPRTAVVDQERYQENGATPEGMRLSSTLHVVVHVTERVPHFTSDAALPAEPDEGCLEVREAHPSPSFSMVC